MALYAKPYLSIPAQVALIAGRGMMIESQAKTEEYLRRIGYYRLSAYWYPFRERLTDANGNHTIGDSYKPQTSFKTVLDLYAFDKALRLILLDGLERVEVSVRTEVALALGQHDPMAHRDPARFDGKFTKPRANGLSDHAEWVARLDKKASDSKEEFAAHFRNKYPQSTMPVWIAVELLDFGPLSMLLKGMRYKDQLQIAQGYGIPNPQLLTSWIWSLSAVRNVCAHHARLWNKPLVVQPSLPSPKLIPDLDHIRNTPGTNSRLYAAVAIIRFILRQVNPRSEWHKRLAAHLLSFPTSPVITLSAAGFPANWQSERLWNFGHY